MKSLRSILIVFFAVSLFLGASGIHVFEHFCKMDGADYSLFVPLSDHCKPAQKIESCCNHPENKLKAIQQKCCEDEVISYQINLDYIQKELQSLVYNFLPVEFNTHTYFQFIQPVQTTQIALNTNRTPPKKGKEILIIHQVFRI